MWFLVSLLSAVSDTARNAINKSLSASLSPEVINLSIFLFATPFYLLLFLDSGPVEVLPDFWLYFALHLLLEFFSNLALTRALRMGELSLVAPLLGTSGVFLTLPGLFLSPEDYGFAGFLGSVLIAVGVFLCRPRGEGKASPAVVALGLLVAVLWAIDGQVLKAAAGAASWQLLLLASSLAVSALFLARLFAKRRRLFDGIDGNGFLKLLGLGAASAASLGLMMIALDTLDAPVGYVISVKRLSMVFGMWVGFSYFAEKSTPARIAGGVLSFAGALAIALSR